MLKRWTAVAGLGLSVLLVGCDASEPDIAPAVYDPLPDPTIEWHSIADRTIEEGPCSALLPILNAAMLIGDGSVADYADTVEELASCGWRVYTDYGNLAQQFRQAANLDTEHFNIELRQIRDRVAVPLARAFDIREYERLGIEMSEELQRRERRWVERCDGPLELRTGNFYQLRRAIAHEFQDNSFLIPEWEERLEECRGLGPALFEEYGRLAGMQSTTRSRQLVEKTMEQFRVTLNILD